MNATESLPWFDEMQSQVARLPPDSNRARKWGESLVAVHFRVVYFAYHRDEFTRLIAEGLSHLPESEHDRDLIAAAFGERDAKQLSVNAVLATAQLVAAAQAIHAACDLFCRVAYWALALDTTALSLRLGSLNIDDLVKSSFGKSKVELERLRESDEFRYLVAFVNVNKHRHLLGDMPSLSLEGGVARGGLSIAEFQYGCGSTVHEHPSKWAADFLAVDCETVVDRLNGVGKALASDMV